MMEPEIQAYLDRGINVMVICENDRAAFADMERMREKHPTKIATRRPPVLYYDDLMVIFRGRGAAPQCLHGWGGVILFHPFSRPSFYAGPHERERYQQALEIAKYRNMRHEMV